MIIFAIFLVITLVFYFGYLVKYHILKRDDAKLEKNGLPATATLVSSAETGIYTGKIPQLELTLNIKNDIGETWQVIDNWNIPHSKLYLMAPGSVFKIKYDPKDKHRIYIYW